MEHFSKLPWEPIYTQLYGTDQSYDLSLSYLGYYSLALTVAFTVGVYAFEGYLDSRQRNAYQRTTFPDELRTTVNVIDTERATATTKSSDTKEVTETKTSTDGDDDSKKKEIDDNAPLLPQLENKFMKSQLYGTDKITFGMIASLWDTTESIFFLLIGFMPYIWDISCQFGKQYFQLNDEYNNEIYISLIFLLFMTIIGTITSLPFELYSTFYIERKHGFNKQTIGLFISDKIKGLLLSMIIGGPFISLLLYIIKNSGQYFYLYVWAFMFIFSIIMMTIVPVVIMPLFNKYEPLPEGDLKRDIYALALQLKFPLTKLFVMDGSKRSSHSNAFMFGFGNNKRIVLFDTLLTQVHSKEILAILGHELGHWKLGHTIQNLIVQQLYMGIAFYAFALTYGSIDLYAAFGFNDISRPTPTLIALMLFFQTLWAPVDKILSFVLTVSSRHNEFAADKFSYDLGMSQNLQSGLCKIHLENLGAMCPDPLYSTYHYSHPPLVERLSAMMTLDQKKK